MATFFQTWQFWAVLSAVFAALTAIFAKVGVQDMHPDLATLLRTVVILLVLATFVTATGEMRYPSELSAKGVAFLVLSGLATGASWVCYFRALKLGDAARVAPLDKLSVVLVAVFAVAFLGERLLAYQWAGVLMIFGGIVLLAM